MVAVDGMCLKQMYVYGNAGKMTQEQDTKTYTGTRYERKMLTSLDSLDYTGFYVNPLQTCVAQKSPLEMNQK